MSFFILVDLLSGVVNYEDIKMKADDLNANKKVLTDLRKKQEYLRAQRHLDVTTTANINATNILPNTLKRKQK